MSSSPGSNGELFVFQTNPRHPHKRRVSNDAPVHRASRRARFMAVVLTFSLLGLAAGIWQSPAIRRNDRPAPSQLEVELASERARSEDLREQIADMSERLRRPHPSTTDGSDEARAEDLARQVDALEAKLDIRRPPTADGSQRSRAEDLQSRLREAEARLKAPRPPGTNARADDLARQVQDLNDKVSRPRPAPDRFAGVSAHLTKADIVAATHQFGLYTEQAPFNWGEAGLVESAVDRKANIVGYFQDWNDPFRSDAVLLAWQRHQIPMLTWEPAPTTGREDPDNPANLAFNLPSIIDGQHDDYIRSYARGVRGVGMPIILRLAHEMNGDWYPWAEVQRKDRNGDGTFSPDEDRSINGNRRGDYVRMWRHVHDIFEEEGANDLTVWLWAPNRVNNITTDAIHQPRISEYYPGDQYADWVGMSGYLRYSDRSDPPTFATTYYDTLRQLRQTTSRRIFLAEIAATELNGTKAQWIASLFQGLAANPDIIGFAWFSLVVSAMKTDGVQTNDWRINSTGPARDALAQGLAQGEFGLSAD